MISRIHRFHGHNSLHYLYKNGKAVRSQLFTIKFVANEHRAHSRVAIVISKKVIKSAVGRNRVRRRLYEYMRTNLERVEGTYDIVVICTSGELRTLPYGDISEQLDQLFIKSSLYK